MSEIFRGKLFHDTVYAILDSTSITDGEKAKVGEAVSNLQEAIDAIPCGPCKVALINVTATPDGSSSSFFTVPFTPAVPPCRRCGVANGSNVQHVCLNNEVRPAYNNWAFQNILHQHFNRLRARLMNLAESSTRDRQQSDAMKGLMKDFLNDAYHPALRELETFLRDKDIIETGEGCSGGDHGRLNAQSLKDILFESEAGA